MVRRYSVHWHRIKVCTVCVQLSKQVLSPNPNSSGHDKLICTVPPLANVVHSQVPLMLVRDDGVIYPTEINYSYEIIGIPSVVTSQISHQETEQRVNHSGKITLGPMLNNHHQHQRFHPYWLHSFLDVFIYPLSCHSVYLSIKSKFHTFSLWSSQIAFMTLPLYTIIFLSILYSWEVIRLTRYWLPYSGHRLCHLI